MRNAVLWLLAIAIGVQLPGCSKGPKLLRGKGQVVKDGEDFVPDDEENLQVALVPIQDDNSPAKNFYYAEVDQSSGRFFAAGADKKGVPPGSYRVLVELKKDKKDLLKGKFFNMQSPFIFEIDDNSEPMVVDIGASDDASN
jgi:hypothetical protein